jgi:integrase
LKPLRRGRQPAITNLKQLRKMIDDAEGDYARPITRLALRFLALTAVRLNELRGARWDEFEDLDGPLPATGSQHYTPTTGIRYFPAWYHAGCPP